MFRKIVFSLFALCSLVGSELSLASDEESYLDSEELLRQELIVQQGSSTTLHMNMMRYVDHVELDSVGIVGDGMFEVVVNGRVKGTIYVPGTDPRYVVTIAEETRSFTLRHLSGSKAKVTSFKAFFGFPGDSGSGLPCNRQDAANISRSIISKMSQYQAKVSVDDFMKHILPIKIAAGHSYAIASASGDLSRRLGESLQVLQTQFHQAKPFFDSSMEVNELFELSVQSLELMYRLDDLVD